MSVTGSLDCRPDDIAKATKPFRGSSTRTRSWRLVTEPGSLERPGFGGAADVTNSTSSTNVGALDHFRCKIMSSDDNRIDVELTEHLEQFQPYLQLMCALKGAVGVKLAIQHAHSIDPGRRVRT